MIDSGVLVPLLAGVVFGVVFFGGLWWTVQRAMSSPRVAQWFFASLLVRLMIVLPGFYWVCGKDWQNWLAALLGFSMARWAISRVTRPSIVIKENNHAS
ncbi:ATP synthase subunit I [Pectobacteriaceae bacterium C52]|uniref:ATP synthase subunit I n=1 Tax=Serratia sp. (strain ATCC 39006) TaxID=104623 RepID=A0A2I5TKJ6_SERS3|nr:MULTISPECIES: ATP synthase subunit I [Enterobacterales]AUH00764.1 ATP synthase subunit I [Serratia sp. ATCC 39006]AUH05085.1 ATP synthase subunit I [Serratia sp. ATCC 39006]WJV64542.1 ATP synthase subunit I [Pectobacteriaceae bacterium C52]